ncbi:hypothetical protein BGZ74_000070 [Mortierella antarctica]|nr:hypothetical protein BGZ74_000070 [Mortierella antarctica]
MSSRRRAAGAGRKPKVIYPTSTQPNPDPYDSVPTMSVADRTLAQSRQSWTHGAFARFYPEPPRAGGKKHSPEVTPAGTCTVCIGPHMFLDTKFFTVYNPPPPPRSLSPSADPTMSGQQELLEEEHIHTPSLFMGAQPGPIPERVIELIMARTAGTPLPPELEEENATEEREAAAAAASSLLSTLTTTETTAAITAAISEAIAEESKDHGATEASAMDVDKDESSMDIDIPTISSEVNHTIPSEQTLGVQLTTEAKEDTVMAESDTVTGTTLKTELENKALSPSGISTPLSVSTSLGGPKQKSASKSSPPRYQVIFEFKENPGVRWLFPSETSLELTPAEDNEPAKISSSFYLTTQADKKPHSDGTSPSSTTPTTTSSQATTMVILQATNELWEGLDRSVLDSSLVYRSMMEKMRHIPVRSYIRYTLPVTFTNEDLAPMGLWKLPDNKVVTIKSLQPPKRRSEPNVSITQFMEALICV